MIKGGLKGLKGSKPFNVVRLAKLNVADPKLIEKGFDPFNCQNKISSDMFVPCLQAAARCPA